jgi:biotin carboxylase
MPSTTYHASDFMAAAGRMQAEVIVATDRDQAVSTPELGRVLPLPFDDVDESIRRVRELAAERPLTALVPTDDVTAVLAAVLSEALGLPANPPEAARATRGKDVLRRRTRDAGLRTPRFRSFPLGTDPASAAGEVGYPCVLKPTFLAASRGVIRADDPPAFARAFRRIRRLLSRPELRREEASSTILVEDFVPGPEVALEGLVRRSRLETLALFDKPDPLDGPFFQETIYVTPSRLPDPVQVALREEAEAAARVIGLVEGPVHAELRLSPAGPVLIDLGARMIGGLCPRTLRFGTGLSLEEVILQHALDRDVPPPPRECAAAGVLMIPIPAAGILREVQGVEAARHLPGVVEVDVTIPPGNPVAPPPEGDRYLGFAFARAETAAKVEAILRRAQDLLRPVVEADGDQSSAEVGSG